MLVRDEGGESGVSAVLPVMNYSQGTCGGWDWWERDVNRTYVFTVRVLQRLSNSPSTCRGKGMEGAVSRQSRSA